MVVLSGIRFNLYKRARFATT